ncbi:DUF2892 domain-containing protein [Pseudomonas sp. RIT-PI-S]|uniref:DUF2892 domain-containing protein n=1 Tax=Pseudomonas sp. RIT-PI-S TaxID=3035295 RepID=UPI0021DA8DD0|nr:DUF2892 domain-containing protein [Pseudomonas sp. RIT-PI-S]
MSKDIITEAIEALPSSSATDTNVHGWERAGSLAGGLLLVGKGVRRGGLFGLVQIALGGVALARGFTGRSKTKSLLAKGREELEGLRGNIERAGDQLKELKNSAEAATSSATVTGNDSLESPKA